MRVIHAQLKYWTPVSDKKGKKEEARPSLLQTKIRPRSPQIAKLSQPFWPDANPFSRECWYFEWSVGQRLRYSNAITFFLAA